MAKNSFRWEEVGFVTAVLMEDERSRDRPRGKSSKASVGASGGAGQMPRKTKSNPPKAERRCRRQSTPLFDPTVVAASYENGATLHGLAKKHGVGLGRIYKAVVEFGGAIRKAGPRSTRPATPGLPADSVRVIVGNGQKAVLKPGEPPQPVPESMAELAVKTRKTNAAGAARGSAEKSYQRWLAQNAREAAE